MIPKFVRKIDATLFIVTIILVLLGLLLIFSTSYNIIGTDLLNFKKQFIFAIVGVMVMVGMVLFDYRALKNYTSMLYIFACLVLAAVLLFGKNTRGTISWFSFGSLNFQPVEMVKVIIAIILAKYLSRTGSYYGVLKKIIVSGIYVSVPVFLIVLQPDLGSALVVIFIWFSMLFLSGIERRQLLIIFFISLAIFCVSWLFVFKEYQKERILTFINPQSDSLGAGYNVIQSIVAIGSGKIWGKGLGYGSQSQLNFLPEKHTDFIFAVIAEEMGFVGVLLVLGLFSIVFHRLIIISIEAQDNFGKFLVLGISFTLFYHVMINVGMNMGIIPIMGIPLPFISYGGSSLISFLVMIGIAQSVYVNGRKYKVEKDERDVC